MIAPRARTQTRPVPEALTLAAARTAALCLNPRLTQPERATLRALLHDTITTLSLALAGLNTARKNPSRKDPKCP